MMKRFLAILCILTFGVTSNIDAQTAGENFDVTHYDINLWNFDFTNHTLEGETFITFTVTAPTSTLVLELKQLTVTDVACDYYNVESFNQEEDFLTVTFDETLEAGETAILDIRYGGNTFNESWGGIHWWSDYVYNLGVGFDSQPHNLGKTWFPCVDDFTDKATYSLAITVTNDKKAICGGNHTTTIDNGDGTSTWYWEVPQEVATYHVSFAIGNYVLWEDTYNGIERDIPITVYVKPSQIDKVPGTFVHIKDIAAFFETSFGAYPFNRIGYVCTGQGCMEHIDNIAITGGIITGNTTQEDYLAHELSHMYFGNKTTCSTAGDMWLNEGFAQFCGCFYHASVYSEEDFQAIINTKINNVTNWCKSESHWIPLNNIPLDMTYDGTAVYDRGAVIVNTMMNYMGRENFLTGLQHYLETYAYNAASSEQLRDALTEATGIDMNGFFDTYVFIGGMPHYEVGILDVTPNGTQYDTRIRMNYWHRGPSHVGMNNRVEVTFVSADGELQTELVGWDGMEDEQIVVTDFEPIAAFADYYNHFLDAKIDKNMTVTTPSSFSISKFQITVNSVTDSVMLRIEDHFVAPYDDPEIPGLTLSTSHYWNALRCDHGNADVTGMFLFNQTSDGDIIHTANDSAVLLYRANVMDEWHTIPYTQEGNWKTGRFTVNDLQTGQYTIGAIDKALLGLEDPHTTYRLFPNPAKEQVTLQWNETASGEIHVFNQNFQRIKTIPYYNTNQITFATSDMKPGVYFVEQNLMTYKLIVK